MINPVIHKTLVVSVLPPGFDRSLTTVRVFVQALQNTAPIPDGVLYACTFAIAPSVTPDCYPVRIGSPMVFDSSGALHPFSEAADGAIGVSLVGAGGCP